MLSLKFAAAVQGCQQEAFLHILWRAKTEQARLKQPATMVGYSPLAFRLAQCLE